MSVPISSPTRTSFLVPASMDRPGDDPIFALDQEARARAAAGEDILNATLGALMEDDGRLAVMASVRAAIERVPQQRAAGYAPIAGEPRFLEAVRADLFGEGPLAAQSIAVATPGGTGAIHHSIVNFLDPGQALLTTSYYWGPYKTLAEHTRRRIATFRMFDGSGRLDLAGLEAMLDRQAQEQGRVLLVLNTPCHNPTGYSLDEQEWQGVTRLLKARAERVPIALLLDLAYAHFGARGSEAWVRYAAELAGDVLVLCAWTISKAFTQYGARVGALVAVHPDAAERKRIANALAYSCRGTWSNCNHLGMLSIGTLLDDPELRARSLKERERLRALLGERVAAFKAAASNAKLDFPRYEGGFFVTVFTRNSELTARTMRELGVYVVPLPGAVRVALCSTPVGRMQRLVDALVTGVHAAG